MRLRGIGNRQFNGQNNRPSAGSNETMKNSEDNETDNNVIEGQDGGNRSIIRRE